MGPTDERHTVTVEREQLLQAIAAQERLRGTLPDVVVNAAISAIEAQVKALESRSDCRPDDRRKHLTVLFADVTGFTAMSEHLDAEEVNAVMNALWQRLDRVITKHNGYIDKHIGDAVMALWGVEHAREDDAEQAIRAALAMQAEIQSFHTQQRSSLSMRIGLNSGPLLLGSVGTTQEFTAIGDTVNLASRLEHAAPVGSVLISHAVYSHVRGIFDVTPRSPLQVKGKSGTIQTYVVRQAKPRAFRGALDAPCTAHEPGLCDRRDSSFMVLSTRRAVRKLIRCTGRLGSKLRVDI